MPTVIVNDSTFEGEAGERLMDTMRRNAAHTGFLCGGIGVCQTCICRVTKGAEHLSELNEVEQRFVRKSWLDTGHRMSCQARIQGPGPIELTTRAEQLRREAMAIFAPPEGTVPVQNATVLVNHIGRILANQLVLFPANAAGAVGQIFKHPPSIKRISGVIVDAGRVSQFMITGKVPPQPQNQAAEEQQTQSG